MMFNLIVLKRINNILHQFIYPNIPLKNTIGTKNLILIFFLNSLSPFFLSLKCNRIVPLREHVFQHQNKKSSSFSGFHIDSIDSSISIRCPSPPRVHYCYLCRTNFDTAIKMHIHLIEHQYPNHDYRCTLCEQCSFDNAAQLYHHMVQHGSKARLHPCRECDVFFMFSMHLINHQYSHSDETLLSKTNGNSRGSKVSGKSKLITNGDHKQSNDDDDSSCRSIVTRSSRKGACRSVIVS